ncbi:L-threonylcarbamoyladenylate synthase [Geoglobus acetivorans]|uniref:Threonylcarbamoyl-AMP synthase n=1 Tax=Geoglobus acetivorans TaxID=565033 RepID=A0A0A7GC14_GEOAI|nr:TsaC protein (YrdC-Sua5 domains) required for threonylcarbamoyladenosine t(6)A37 modification in tRNA [Geoglobus acetivorans]
MRIIRISSEKFSEEELSYPAELIKAGNLVAFPTETVYGLGANALEGKAVRKIFAAKGRPSDNPLIVHVHEHEQIYELAKPNRVAEKLVEEFFPGPLTLVMRKKEVVPGETTGGLNTVAVRMPAHKVALKLIELSGVPIAAPSANKSGKPSPTRAEHVIEDFGNEIDCIIDAGKTRIGLESTVVDTTTYPLEILRPGAITREMLEEFFEVKVIKKSDVARSPGMKYRHYSPEADVIVLVGDTARDEMRELAERLSRDGRKVGIAAMKADEFEGIATYNLGSTLREFAERLFDALRELDRVCDVIIVEGVEEKGLGLAIMNRLSKAGRVYRV